MANVFRRASLDRISSPDQLDSLLVVTKPLSWVGVVAALALAIGVVLWAFTGSLPVTMTTVGYITPDVFTNTIYSSAQGKVQAVYVNTGSHIKKGTAIADVVGASGVKRTVVSHNSGTVDAVLVKPGDELTTNAEIVRYSNVSADDNILLCLVPYSQAPQLSEGMGAKATLADGSEAYATVANVDQFIVSPESLGESLDPTGQIAAQLMGEGPMVVATCTFDTDDEGSMAYATNMPASVQFFLAERAPISMVLPVFGAN